MSRVTKAREIYFPALIFFKRRSGAIHNYEIHLEGVFLKRNFVQENIVFHYQLVLRSTTIPRFHSGFATLRPREIKTWWHSWHSLAMKEIVILVPKQ